ncbi:MAG TPA: endonuclease MutS2, partial [Spirochaetales bacterium]|nr:endonuclease MutS2 [Spirochaetales bacterium]
MMNEHSIRLLDFARIRSSVAEYCISNEGRQLLLSSVPVNNEEYLERFKDEVAALSSYLSKNDLPGCTFPEIESAMEHLGVEGLTLEGDELCALGTWAKSFDLVTSFLSKAHVLVQHSVQVQQLPKASAHKVAELVQDAPEMQSSEAWVTQTLSYLVAASPKLTDVHRIIQSVFQDDGQMRELPSIRRAREEITRANRDIQSVVARYRDNPEVRVALQNEEAIQRDGRTVLAVKANFKSRVSGIIHEVSASGQTVFVEPADLVEKNNELVQKEAQLKAEIFRVLRETTEKLKPYRQSLEAARASLAQMDVRLARALQCKREKLSFAASCPQGISIWNARHPFLGKKAVPIDVLLPEDIRTLIITGPNTGGKTVTLKTVGLLAMMNQFGLAIPAAEGTKLAVFDDILADIGDEQSIDESLSTFSGHMKVIAEIAHRATSKSLVLLDELGAGTDPEEGCALAMGLLDYFIDKGSLTLVTTHHGVLKKYG